MDFHEQFDKDFIALRLISAKLIEARQLAVVLPTATRAVLDATLEHIEGELAAVTQILAEEEEE